MRDSPIPDDGFTGRPRAARGRRCPRLLPAVLLSWIAAAACAGAGGSDETILVLAAASTIDALEAAVSDFEAETGIEVEISFGPTSTVALQIVQGAPADLMLSANGEWADYVEDRIPVRRRVTLVGNQLIVVQPTPRRAEDGVATSLRELFDDPRRRFAIADPQSVPAGIYARQALRALGFWESVEPRLIPTIDVRAALALVARREVDGAFVYATDAASSSAISYVGDIDPLLHDPIEYPLLLLAGAGEEAAALFEFLVSARGRAHFFDRGFTDPSR